jgi:holo-[acyl-carrier protein] synthase
MILGIGTDVVQIERIKNILSIHRERFIKRILVESEISQMNKLSIDKQENFIAKRFAAKEAISKAFGVGISKEIGFCDIEISNNSLGKPVAHIAKYDSKYKIHLSLSDDYPVVVAFCVIEFIN